MLDIIGFIETLKCRVFWLAGRSGLVNHKAVHKLRGLMLQCLYALIKTNHAGQLLPQSSLTWSAKW